VVALNRVVDESEAPTLAGLPEAPLQLADQSDAAQGRDVGPDLESDVTRKSRGERRAPLTGVARVRTPLASRALPRTTPARAGAQIETKLVESLGHQGACSATPVSNAVTRIGLNLAVFSEDMRRDKMRAPAMS
jgi:hypothetical protein